LWQKISKPLEIVVIITSLVLFIFVIVMIVAGYIFRWDWTGLGAHPQGKTLWDWLQLLIIPAVLAIGSYAFNLTVSRNEQKNIQLRDQTERDISLDNQREAALQAYIDKMSELLLEKQLRDSKPEDEVRKIARVRTLTVLQRLDASRKVSLLQFLYESGLIYKDKPIINLAGADLHGVNLQGVDLRRAALGSVNLSGADLRLVNLREAFLEEADLSEVNLSGAYLIEAFMACADLREADLSGADLRGASLRRADMSETDLSATFQLRLSSSPRPKHNPKKLLYIKGPNTDLCFADLGLTILCGANLTNAHMERVDLREAKLKGANFTSAIFLKEQEEQTATQAERNGQGLEKLKQEE